MSSCGRLIKINETFFAVDRDLLCDLWVLFDSEQDGLRVQQHSPAGKAGEEHN